MTKIYLTPGLIDAYKQLVTEPAKHNLDITPITDYFKESNKVTAKHILAAAYIAEIKKPLPKLILYIIMDELYGMCIAKDSSGNLGYYLQPNL